MGRTGQGGALRLIGNDGLLERLLDDIREERLSHAYILEGRAGSGRHTLARVICAALVCRRMAGRRGADLEQGMLFPGEGRFPCGTCAACRKVLEGRHPDILVVGRGGAASVGVDAARLLRDSVVFAPNESDRKIYLLEDADVLTKQAQNALLRTLEDPPPYALFLLLCERADNLLETIRSRAPILRLSPVPDEDIRGYLAERRPSLSEEALAAAVTGADGRIGRALELAGAAPGGAAKSRALVDDFLAACAGRRAEAFPPMIPRFGNKRPAVIDVLSLLTLAARDLLLLRRSRRVRLKYYVDRRAAEDLAARFTEPRLLALLPSLERAADSLQANGNIRLTLTALAVEAAGLDAGTAE